MADAADDSKRPDEAASDDTLLATPGSSGSGKPVQADASALAIDTSDRYALAEVHAAGGLGRVMRARDRRLHRTVAVKELLQRTPAAEARFVREALITAQLEHPGIVPVHDAGRWPSGEPYYSMKLVSGRTLRDLIQAKKGLDERLALVPNAIAVAEAIAYAHSRDVIHRDIKPSNVLVGEFGETLVIDWGLAKDLSGRVAEPEVEAIAAAAASGSGSLETEVGNVMGTPAYMSPEQARGEDLDARADVYSLGALLYELLTGQPPHTGPSLQDVLASAQKGRVAPVAEREPHAPPDLCAIVTKAMAADRAARYPTAMAMAADLRRFQTGKLVTARHYSTPALVWRWVARHRAIVAVVLAAMAALALVGVWSFRRVMAQRNRAEHEMHSAQRARDELIFRQAESLLERDPTAALAVLKAYPVDGDEAARLGPMIDEALAAGVARHVLRHPGWVERLAFAPDGRLVTSDDQGNLISWDVASGRGRRVLRHGVGRRLLFAPDGATVAIALDGGVIEMQSTLGGPPIRLTGLAPAFAVGMAYSEDGRRLMAIGEERVRVWEVASGAELFALDHEVGEVGNLSPDGSRLYIAREAGEILEFRVGAGAAGAPRIAARLENPAVLLKVSPDGKQLLLQDTASDLELLDLASGAARLLGHQRLSADGWVEFSHARDRVALTASDSTIVIYRLAAKPGEAPTVLRGHSDPAYRAHFSPDDRLLYSSSDDGTVRIWNLISGEAQVLRGHGDDVIRIALSPDGKWLASASLDRTARLWPLGDGIARLIPGEVKDAAEIAFAAGGTRLMAGNPHGGESWDLATGQSVAIELEYPPPGTPAVGDRLFIAIDGKGRAELRDITSGELRLLPAPSSQPIVAVGIATDDARAATVDAAGSLLLWDLASGQSRPVAASRTPTRVVFLPGRREVLLAGIGFLELWDLEAGRAVARAPLSFAPAHEPNEIVVSQDGRVVSSRDHRAATLIVWNTASGTVQHTDCDDSIGEISLAPDGSQVALALGDRTVKLWRLDTGASRLLAGHTDFVYQAVFSPDGRMVASCSFDRTVRLWRLDRAEPRVLRGHGSEVKAVAFSRDGATLASIGGDGTIRLWPLAALPDDSPAAVPARLAGATTAVVDGEGRVFTPWD